MTLARNIVGMAVALSLVVMVATSVLENLYGPGLLHQPPAGVPTTAPSESAASTPSAPQATAQTSLPQEQVARLGEYMARLQANPHDPELLLEIGRLFLDAGEASQAENFFRRASVAAPTDPRPHHFLGLAYAGVGNFQQAAHSFEHAVDLGGEPSTVFNLGIVYRYHLNQPDKARELFSRVANEQTAPASLRDKAKEELESLGK